MPSMRQVKSWPKILNINRLYGMLRPLRWLFYLRIFKKAVEEQGHNEVARYLVKELAELFIIIAECIREVLC